MHLYHKSLKNLNIAFEKGFLYSELFYGTKLYVNYTPSDESIIEEYNSLDPFELFNSDIMNHLIILNDNVFKYCIRDATNIVTNDINNIGHHIEILLKCLIILYVTLFLLFNCFYVIPNIIKKNNNINKKRKMLLIIPKNVLLDIIVKNK
jgi:hypothetical protein